MKKYLLLSFLLVSQGLFTPTSFAADASGPWIKVENIYSRTTSAKPFVTFKADAMPGCYGNSGGYLGLSDESGTQRTFSVLMSALIASREVKVYYNFYTVADDYTGWGLCEIEAVFIR